MTVAPLSVQGTDPPSVPEPATIGLVALGVVGLLRTRKLRQATNNRHLIITLTR